MKCPYCGDSVVIPPSLRISAAPAPRPRAEPPAFETPNASSTRVKQAGSSSGADRKPASGTGTIITVGLVVALAVVAYSTFGASIISSMLFAHRVMSFGSQGTGPGMFQDARAIGVDGTGNIVVAEHADGRVQVFGPDGKFVSLFNITGTTTYHYILGMAVSRDGKIYIAALNILIYDEKGRMLGQLAGSGYDDVALGADGTVYALAGEDLVRFKSDGSIDLQIPKAVSSISGQPSGSPRLAVDGLGDMFIVDDIAEAVFKYSPDGKFVNQFGGPVQLGGSCRDCNTFQPGKFWSPTGIAVDGHGRIIVSDFDATQVFDSTGRYLNHFSGGFFGIALDEQGSLYATTFNDHNVVKFLIQKP